MHVLLHVQLSDVHFCSHAIGNYYPTQVLVMEQYEIASVLLLLAILAI